MQALPIAFNRPETACRPTEKRLPVDLDHLGHQTMGQKDLEEEVLRLFLRQARQCLRNIERSSGRERSGFAHTLKGSARGVGAFTLADAAARLENSGSSEADVEALSKALVDVETFLARLAR